MSQFGDDGRSPPPSGWEDEDERRRRRKAERKAGKTRERNPSQQSSSQRSRRSTAEDIEEFNEDQFRLGQEQSEALTRQLAGFSFGDAGSSSRNWPIDQVPSAGWRGIDALPSSVDQFYESDFAAKIELDIRSVSNQFQGDLTRAEARMLNLGWTGRQIEYDDLTYEQKGELVRFRENEQRRLDTEYGSSRSMTSQSRVYSQSAGSYLSLGDVVERSREREAERSAFDARKGMRSLSEEQARRQVQDRNDQSILQSFHTAYYTELEKFGRTPGGKDLAYQAGLYAAEAEAVNIRGIYSRYEPTAGLIPGVETLPSTSFRPRQSSIGRLYGNVSATASRIFSSSPSSSTEGSTASRSHSGSVAGLSTGRSSRKGSGDSDDPRKTRSSRKGSLQAAFSSLAGRRPSIPEGAPIPDNRSQAPNLPLQSQGWQPQSSYIQRIGHPPGTNVRPPVPTFGLTPPTPGFAPQAPNFTSPWGAAPPPIGFPLPQAAYPQPPTAAWGGGELVQSPRHSPQSSLSSFDSGSSSNYRPAPDPWARNISRRHEDPYNPPGRFVEGAGGYWGQYVPSRDSYDSQSSLARAPSTRSSGSRQASSESSSYRGAPYSPQDNSFWSPHPSQDGGSSSDSSDSNENSQGLRDPRRSSDRSQGRGKGYGAGR